MKAAQFDELGPPEALRIVDIPEPHAGPGQIRVAVRAAGVNPVDWKIRSGASKRATPIPLPSVPGLDAAGIVDEVGADVRDIAVGDAVFGNAVSGAAAQYAVLSHWAVKPDTMSWAEASGLATAVETAGRALDVLGVGEGYTVLISGAAGGVGAATVQFARARGAHVIGTASRDNLGYLESLGALATTYGPGLPDRVRLLAPGGVDGALDIAGHEVLPDLIEIVGSPENVVSVGDFGSPALGVHFTMGQEGRAYYAFALAADLFRQGRFTMPVARTFPLEEIAEAHRISEAGHVRGKLVVLTGDSALP
jgi:NADPH:quinone reductase-like Zn-dependent oxidoreductase